MLLTAKKQPPTFLALAARLIPQQVEATLQAAVRLIGPICASCWVRSNKLCRMWVSARLERFSSMLRMRLNPPHGRVLPVTTRHEADSPERPGPLTAVSGKSLISIKLTASPQL
jgi:hypothetical protein